MSVRSAQQRPFNTSFFSTDIATDESYFTTDVYTDRISSSDKRAFLQPTVFSAQCSAFSTTICTTYATNESTDIAANVFTFCTTNCKSHCTTE